MATPSTRQEFKDYCLRKLGYPVIEINVDDDQVEDRIDEALKYYIDYHFDATDKVYYKYQLTQTDVDNKYFAIPDNIMGVVKIFDFNSIGHTASMFDVRYQIIMNDLYSITSTTLVPYYMTMQHLQFMQQILVGQQAIRYNRHMNRLYLDVSAERLSEGMWIVVEAYQVVDPDDYSDVWGDRWLLKYATQLIKKQWGTNLSKFIGLQLPGGVMFNAEKIYDEAEREIEKMEEEMLNSYSLPSVDMIG